MPDTITLSQALANATSLFRAAKIETPQLDAKLLLCHAADMSSAQIISRANEPLDRVVHDAYECFIKRRLNHEPVHRILGYREFYGREFFLTQETLIPRPDTETLVEAALALTPKTILEIGTGSGAIAVTLAAELSSTDILATDISENALVTAQKNADRLGVSKQIAFIQSDIYESVSGQFDMIVSNPPYIPTAQTAQLQEEVRTYDPILALDGGVDGLDFYRVIFEEAHSFLKPNGSLLVEIGYTQKDDVMEIAEKSGFKRVDCKIDLNGLDRVIIANIL